MLKGTWMNSYILAGNAERRGIILTEGQEKK
jgi:hypothetical protein